MDHDHEQDHTHDGDHDGDAHAHDRDHHDDDQDHDGAGWLGSVPLRDSETQAEVIDLVLGLDERRAGALAVMVCDDQDRGVQPIVVTDIPDDAPPDGLESLLGMLLPLVRGEEGAIVVARGRRSGLVPTDTDRAWHQYAIEACRRHGVRLLGYHLATPYGVEPLPQPLDASA